MHTALQLGAPTSIECVSLVGNRASITYPDRGMVRLDFPARGDMPPVKVFYHDGPHPTDPDVYHVPGMENETILPPVNNLSRQGSRRRRPWGGGGGASGRRPWAPQRVEAARGRDPNAPRQGAGGPGVRVFGEPAGPATARVSHRQRQRSSSAPRASWPPPTAAKACGCFRPRAGRITCCRRSCSPGPPATCWIGCAPAKAATLSCSDFSIAAPYAEWLTLIAIAFRVPGKLDWDSKNLRFTNSAEANKYVQPVARKGWEMKL